MPSILPKYICLTSGYTFVEFSHVNAELKNCLICYTYLGMVDCLLLYLHLHPLVDHLAFLIFSANCFQNYVLLFCIPQ